MDGDCQPPKPSCSGWTDLLACLRAKLASTQTSSFGFCCLANMAKSAESERPVILETKDNSVFGDWAMIRYSLLGVLFWEVQISCSTVEDRMKAPSTLTLAVYHFKFLMKKVRRYGCLFVESATVFPVLCTGHQPNSSLLLIPSVDKS